MTNAIWVTFPDKTKYYNPVHRLLSAYWFNHSFRESLSSHECIKDKIESEPLSYGKMIKMADKCRLPNSLNSTNQQCQFHTTNETFLSQSIQLPYIVNSKSVYNYFWLGYCALIYVTIILFSSMYKNYQEEFRTFIGTQ